MDALWERVEHNLPTPKRKTSSGLLMALLVGLPTAAALFVVIPTRPPPFVERSGVGSVPVELQASCGTVAQPCKKGMPIYLRLVPHGLSGNADVRLVDDVTPQLLATAVPLAGDTPVLIAVKLVPDEKDVAHGLTLDTTFTGEHQAQPVHSVLTLQVEP